MGLLHVLRVEMMIVYRDSIQAVTADKLRGFFVGWQKVLSPEAHLKVLGASDHVVLAIDRDTDKVVGFVTAITDSVLAAYIPLLEVLPEYQHRGIGTELMRQMLSKLEGLYMIDLVTGPELEPFYARFGMSPAAAMIVRNRDAQIT